MNSPADTARLRSDTPGCEQVIHLNNAGSALPPAVVVDTQVEHLRAEERMGGYEAHAAAADRVAGVYTSLGALFNARADQIAVVESATAAWDRAFVALKFSGVLREGSRILVSQAEYASNVLPALQMARTMACSVEVIPDDATGVVDVAALENMLDDNVALVAINHCPSQNGLINDAAAVGRVLAAHPAYYLLDACQSVGQLTVDASAIGADFFSATGRKFLRGPRGTGFLYVSDRAMNELEPFPLDLHAATWTANGYELQPGARRYESWEKSYAAVLGLGAAADYALACGMENLRARINALAEYTRAGLTDITGITVRDRGEVRSGIVTFTHANIPAAEMVARIKEAGINVSLSTPDYSRTDFTSQGIEGLVRVSPHAYNTEAEIDALFAAVTSATSPTK